MRNCEPRPKQWGDRDYARATFRQATWSCVSAQPLPLDVGNVMSRRHLTTSLRGAPGHFRSLTTGMARFISSVASCGLGRPLAKNATCLTFDSPKGRQTYSQRIGTVEPVFANPAQQANESVHAAWARQGQHAVALVLPRAQHREDRRGPAPRSRMRAIVSMFSRSWAFTALLGD